MAEGGTEGVLGYSPAELSPCCPSLSPPSPPDSAFGSLETICRRHFARAFWNHTWGEKAAVSQCVCELSHAQHNIKHNASFSLTEHKHKHKHVKPEHGATKASLPAGHQSRLTIDCELLKT